MLPPLPRHSDWRHYLAHPSSRVSLPRKGQSGRPAHRPFRGLLSVHSRCGLHTRAATNSWHAYPKASDISSPPCLLRLLPAGAVAGWGLHPLESAAFSRRTSKAPIRPPPAMAAIRSQAQGSLSEVRSTWPKPKHATLRIRASYLVRRTRCMAPVRELRWRLVPAVRAYPVEDHRALGGRGNHEALGLVAAHARDHSERIGRLHALGNHLETEVVREVND